MQSNKYYTPTEQELLESIINNDTIYTETPDKEIIPIKFEYPNIPTFLFHFISEFNNAHHNKNFVTTYTLSEIYKLKYLDKSDLKELGFEYYSYFRDGGTSLFRTSNKEYELHFYRTNSISDIDPNKIKIIRNHENPQFKGSIFVGNIKNKSELKKLLKQLNIQ